MIETMLTLAAVVVVVIVAMIGAFLAAAMIIGMTSLALTVLGRMSRSVNDTFRPARD